MTDYSKLEKIALSDRTNRGLSPAHQSTMLRIFGRPGGLTRDCSLITNQKLSGLLQTRNVGPFRVTGLARLLDSLEAIFQEVQEKNPELFAQVRTDGMICCRAVRGSTENFSNHSWGSAVDIRFGDHSDEMGDGLTQLGAQELAPFFNARGWYWGAGFGLTNPSREDAMHFEASDELIRELYGDETGLLPPAGENLGVEPEAGRLKSRLLARDSTLEAVAAGHAKLSASGVQVPGIGPVQDALNQLGFTIDLGSGEKFRGFFGPKTVAAIEAFQNRHMLEVTGELQQETVRAIDEALLASAGGTPASDTLGPLHSGAELPKRMPKYAEPIFGRSSKVPWKKAKALPEFDGYDGVLAGSVCLFEGLSNLPAQTTTALIYECKLTIDSDGVADADDPDHRGATSLRHHDNQVTSLNAAKEPFGVVPLDAAQAAAEGMHKDPSLPDFGSFGVKLGDIGVALWEKTQEIAVFVIGDQGPPNALGEGSIKLADDLLIPSDPSGGGFNSADVRNMRRGVMHLVFPGSGETEVKKGHVCTKLGPDEIKVRGKKLWEAFLNQQT